MALHAGASTGIATSVSSSAFPLLAPDGSAAAPSYAYASAPSSGHYLTATGRLGTSIGGTQTAEIGTGYFSVTRDLTGAGVNITATNTSNTASSYAYMGVSVGGALADDPTYFASVTGGGIFTWGLDNSQSDRFVIAGASSLGTAATDYVIITTAGAITLAASAGLIGFYGTTPAAKSSAYTVTNRSTDRSYDANSTSVDELADVLGTLVLDLQTVGLIG